MAPDTFGRDPTWGDPARGIVVVTQLRVRAAAAADTGYIDSWTLDI